MALQKAQTRLEKQKALKEEGETSTKEITSEKDDEKLLEEAIAQSRQEFENKGRRDMEIALEESLTGLENEQTEQLMNKEIEQTIKQSLDAYQEKQDEEALLKLIINESKKDQPQDDLDEMLKKALEESKKDLLNQYPPGVQQVIDAGFPVESVLTAYSIVGDDPEMIINFIYENS